MPNATLAALGRDVAARLEANPNVTKFSHGGLTLYYHQQFLSDMECDTLIGMIVPVLEPSSTLLADGLAQNDFRTSSSGNLNALDPFVQQIDARIADFLGVGVRQGETIQGQRYEIGQVFKAHQDYFHTSQPYWAEHRKNGGQRSWTTMVYLDEEMTGGETKFTAAGFQVSPQRGLLLAWNNMDANGDPDPLTLHESLPVETGSKTIITKWFREGNWY